MDAHIAFRCFLEFDTQGGFTNLVHVEGAGFFHRRLPQPRAQIGGLGHVADHHVVAPALLERGHELLVIGVVQALEVLHGGVHAFHVLAADTADFILGDGDGQQQRILFGEIDTGGFHLLVEGHVGAAHHGGEDHIRFTQLDLVYHRVELGVAERVVLLAHHLQTFLLDVNTRDLVGSTRPDVVGAEQVEGLGALLLHRPVDAGENLLGGFLAGVDHVG